MYTEPEDQVPRNQPTPSGGRRGRRLAAILIPAVIMLIVGFTIGHATASHGSTTVAIVTPTTQAPTIAPPTFEDPTSPSASPSLSASDSASPTGTATDTTSATASSTSAAGAGAAQAVYLSQATPVDDGGALTSPVDATISNVDYPNSIQQTAEGPSGTNTVWDVAQYTTFTAEVGIDDSQAADGQTARIVFLNESSVQLGSVEVAIGSPKVVKIALKGAVHFDIDCIADSGDAGYQVTFGNAQFLP